MNRGLQKEIRSLWIQTSPRWGGPEQVAMADIVDMAQAGCGVAVACPEGSPTHAAIMRHQDIKVFSFSPDASARDLRRIFNEIVDSIKPNILHLHDESLVWTLSVELRKHQEISVLVNRHVPTEKRFFLDLIASFYLTRLDYMIALSENVRQSVFASFAIPRKKVKVINLGLDFARFDPEKVSGKKMRASWDADKDTIVVGTVGRLSEELGQDTFIKAAVGLLKSAARHKDRKLKFVVVGEEPLGDPKTEKTLEDLKKLVGLFNIEEFVVFTTLGENLPEVMAGFDVFVMAGREEVPGLGALEALAMQCAVVISSGPGAREIVGDQKYGLLVKNKDAFDLAQKIQQLLENPSQRIEMGTQGRTYVLKHYDKRTRSSKLFDIYEKCLKRRFIRSQRVLNAETS
ncbi:MAG: glycosyltransferase family 4 protein [Bacteriovoracia bacterium]